MKKLIAIVLGILVILFFPIGKFIRLPHWDPYTHATEEEAKSFITIGMDEKAVSDKFGVPFLKDTEKDGGEVWQYCVNPRVVRDANSSYAGFEVFLKDKKVTYLGIIGSSTRNTN